MHSYLELQIPTPSGHRRLLISIVPAGILDELLKEAPEDLGPILERYALEHEVPRNASERVRQLLRGVFVKVVRRMESHGSTIPRQVQVEPVLVLRFAADVDPEIEDNEVVGDKNGSELRQLLGTAWSAGVPVQELVNVLTGHWMRHPLVRRGVSRLWERMGDPILGDMASGSLSSAARYNSCGGGTSHGVECASRLMALAADVNGETESLICSITALLVLTRVQAAEPQLAYLTAVRVADLLSRKGFDSANWTSVLITDLNAQIERIRQ